MERDTDSIRRERWREEERESSNNLAPRRDRWKEGERETVGEQTPPLQNRRGGTDRRVENNLPVGRDPGDQLRRAASDRWADLPNRDGNFDNRRDNKWSGRRGLDEKEKDFRGKWGGDAPDKEVVDGVIRNQQRHAVNPHNGRDSDRDREREREREREKERDSDAGTRHDRAWRPSFARGRGELPHMGTTPPKMAPGFSMGRGRGEPSGVGFTVGRGRGNPQGFGLLHGPLVTPIGSPFRVDNWAAGKDNAFRYPRVKLLDIHRKCGIQAFAKYPDGFTEVPQLTQIEPLEPLAFFQPEMEEEVRLIDHPYMDNLVHPFMGCYVALTVVLFHW